MMAEHCPLPPCTGLVRELGLVAKMCFADKRDEYKVQVGDVVGVRIHDVRLSEHYVWVEFTGWWRFSRLRFRENYVLGIPDIQNFLYSFIHSFSPSIFSFFWLVG